MDGSFRSDMDASGERTTFDGFCRCKSRDRGNGKEMLARKWRSAIGYGHRARSDGAEFPPQMMTAEAVVRGRECINWP